MRGLVTRTRLRTGAGSSLMTGVAPPGRAWRTSTSRSSRVCRRLTVSSVPPTRTLHRPASTRTSSTCASETSRERWIRTKPASRHSTSSVVSGVRIRWLPVGGVQPGVVTVRLDVAHLAAGHEPGHAAELDRDVLLVLVLHRGRGGDHQSPDRLGEPVVTDRLEDVVDGVELERLHRVLVVRGDEHDRRRGAEPGQHPGELETGQAGHPDVDEHRVDVLLLEHPQRLGRRVRGGDRADARVPSEQERELVEGGALVVDDEDVEGHVCTPGAYFGTRTVTLVPAPGAVSTTRP